MNRHLLQIVISSIDKERGPLSELRRWLESASERMHTEARDLDEHRKRLEWYALNDWQRALVMRSQLEKPVRAVIPGMPADLAISGAVARITHARHDFSHRPAILPWLIPEGFDVDVEPEAVAHMQIARPFTFDLEFYSEKAKQMVIQRAIAEQREKSAK